MVIPNTEKALYSIFLNMFPVDHVHLIKTLIIIMPCKWPLIGNKSHSIIFRRGTTHPT